MRLIDADSLKYALGSSDADIYFNALIDEMPTIESPRHDWTPCDEGLPDAFDGEPKDAPWYLCSKKNGTRCILIYQKCGAVDDWRTITGLGISDSVIAYMPLPEPYRADQKEDADGK